MRIFFFLIWLERNRAFGLIIYTVSYDRVFLYFYKKGLLHFYSASNWFLYFFIFTKSSLQKVTILYDFFVGSFCAKLKWRKWWVWENASFHKFCILGFILRDLFFHPSYRFRQTKILIRNDPIAHYFGHYSPLNFITRNLQNVVIWFAWYYIFS